MSRRFALLCLLLLPAPLWAQQSVPPEDELATMEIEPPLPLPEPRPLWPVAAGAALLLGGGLFVLYLRKRKRTPQAVPLPHETALLRLAQADRLIAAHDCAAFAALFDRTLRRYLEERFSIAAPQQTVSELISQLTLATEDGPLKTHSDALQAWLELCEAAKFAGAVLTQAEMNELASQLRAFIATTQTEAAK